MLTKQTARIEPEWTLPAVWQQVASRTRQWLQSQNLEERDAVLLLPFAALLPGLREAFAQAGGWQVRVETTLTMVASLAPAPEPQPGACCGDGVLDRLNASILLRSQRAAAGLAQHDAQSFEHLVTAVVDAAQAFMAAAAAVAPLQRAAFWVQARAAVAQTTGGFTAAALESRLLGVALEWAAVSGQDGALRSDALYALQPSAWIVVRLGGTDPVADAVARASAAPALWLDLDPPLEWGEDRVDGRNGGPVAPAMAPAGAAQAVQRWLCDDFEAEAQAAAALVIDAVNAGRVPVGLVAVDRALVRRVRALLDRQQVPVLDETGWLLATTTAGARVMALLRAAQALNRADLRPDLAAQDCPSACRDAVLDWLKSALQTAQLCSDESDVDALEALWRERRRSTNRVAAARCWQRVLTHLAPLAQGPTSTLQQWLRLIQQQSQADGSLQRLETDPAGRQVLAALHLQGGGPAAWEAATQATRFSLAGFVAWVSATLEQSPYLPMPDEQALVVLTPLARAYGRGFGQVVVPGADHRQLACPASQAALIGPQLARSLGLPDIQRKHRQQRLALVHLFRGGALAFTRRLRDAGEPLSESPDLAWLMQAGAAAAVRPWQTWQGSTRQVHALGVPKPLPVAPHDLPQRLSASQLDAYRQCPYRFFARAVLRLDEPEELDAAPAKRDYGNWLHEVLHRFHSERNYREPAAAQLQTAAAWASHKLALDDGDMLPWRASFEHFSPAYLEWLAGREAQGWYWADGETDYERAGDDLAGTQLRGRLDRLDHGPDGQRQVIDYKTGDAAALARKVRQPLEDTQLAFYAALLAPPAGQAEDPGAGELQACYLALDDPKAPKVIEHPGVAHSAAVMLEALAGEWRRLRQGEPLPALGEGAVCETCEARGLCRRDHWQRAAPLKPPLNASITAPATASVTHND